MPIDRVSFGMVTDSEENSIKLFRATKKYKAGLWKDLREGCKKESQLAATSLKKAMLNNLADF